MTFKVLSATDLALGAALVLLLAALSYTQNLGVGRRLVIAATRTTLQLLLVGYVLRFIFDTESLLWVSLMALFMLAVAGREVLARQERPLGGWWGIGIGTVSMFTSSFSVTIFALLVLIGETPWYLPQYAVPLLGMLLGNTMNGVSLGMGRLSENAYRDRLVLEQRLMLGQDRNEATRELRRDSARFGLVPILNAMAAAGVVSLPGMMTGQILAGSPPVEAVKYQILILFLIAAGTGLGVMVSVSLTARRLFDERHRLRLERLSTP